MSLEAINMQNQARSPFSPVTDSVVAGTNTLFPAELEAESVSMGSRAASHGDLLLGGRLRYQYTNPDVKIIYRWESIVEESFANIMHSESSVDVAIQLLMEYVDQPNESGTNHNPTNQTPTTSAPGTSINSQLHSPETPSTRTDTVPTMLPGHQSYSCSWPRQGLETECDHVAPDRSAFLRHLGDAHQVSGASDETITCQLLDFKTGSACRKSIKRGNFPRHTDTHYPLRYQCRYCPAGKSFSREDSWKKHIRTMHAQTAPAS
ncbi:hypothetical protein J3R83DRAFT_2450 [Lanmaoa asiatica]|nr:hypothetical protein J3R83DRAFT_2450 [Lanmaoa asiatica]